MRRGKKRRRTSTHRLKKAGVVTEFERQVHSGNPVVAFSRLKSDAKYGEMVEVVRRVANPRNPFYKYLFGGAVVHSYSEIHKQPWLAPTNDLGKELNWVLASLVPHAALLNDFVHDAAVFQDAFLCGHYKAAEETLERIIKNTGLSLWSIEKLFLLRDATGGLEENKKFLTEIVQSEGTAALFDFLAHYLSLRSEAKISTENYMLRIQPACTFEDHQSLQNYLRYRLEPFGMDLAPVATDILNFESRSPIVDRYLTFLSVCQSCAVAEKSIADVATATLRKTAGLIRDFRITTILQLDEPTKPISLGQFEIQMLDILDLYTGGEYRETSTKTAQLLSDNPSVYELYYLYLHSLGYSGQPFEQVFAQGSLAAKLLEHIDAILRGEEGWQIGIDGIQKGCLSLWRDQPAHGLSALYASETLSVANEKFRKMALLTLTHWNPRFASVYDDPAQAASFIEQFSKIDPSSATVELVRRQAVRSSPTRVQLPQSLPETRKSIYGALIHQEEGRPYEAVAELTPLLRRIENDQIPGSYLVRDRVTKLLFDCLLQTENITACVDLVVRTYLRNASWIRKIPLDKLLDAIERVQPTEVMRNISYPILYAIVHEKPRPVYVAYDNFLSTLGIKRPSELFGTPLDFSDEYVNYFLSKVCTIEVLACSYHFSGTEDLENERIRICQRLSERDITNSTSYSNEISAITSRSIIRKGMRQLDKSKIYVDEDGIRSAGRRIFAESFSRYEEIASLSNIDKLRMIDPHALRLYLLDKDGTVTGQQVSIDDLATKKLTVISTLQYILFKEFFLDIRDRFISSGEYGLDAYLSIRIRHGVLQNQIRSPFESFHLLSEKDTQTDKYLENSYWTERLSELPQEILTHINKSLAAFSREVDEIARRFNKEMVQVKTEHKNPDGLFDYTFSEEELAGIFYRQFLKISDVDQFLSRVFEILWKRTQENLDRVREFISGELTDNISRALSQMQQEVRPHQAAELIRDISFCQTKLQIVFDGVSHWFTISSSSLVAEFSLDELFYISVQSINNIYPNKKIQPKFLVEDKETRIHGKHFPHFSDIVRTLLGNIIEHSGLTPDAMNIEIGASCKADSLYMWLKNSLAENVKRMDPAGMLSENRSLETSDISDVIAREGGSGLQKVRKILAVDLNRTESDLKFTYDDEGRFVVALGIELKGLQV